MLIWIGILLWLLWFVAQWSPKPWVRRLSSVILFVFLGLSWVNQRVLSGYRDLYISSSMSLMVEQMNISEAEKIELKVLIQDHSWGKIMKQVGNMKQQDQK